MSSLLRTRLLHIAHGCSLRTPSVGAKATGWGSMADVAWLKKLRACEGWLCALGAGLLKESGLRLRLVASPLIQEPGATGSQGRVLYTMLTSPSAFRAPSPSRIWSSR